MTTQKTSSAKLAQSIAKVANSQASAAQPKAKKPVVRKPRATTKTSASTTQKTVKAVLVKSDGGCFHTFGLPPWLHLITWPDGRLALLEFLPLSLDSCCMQLRLFAPGATSGGPSADAANNALLKELLAFLDEDQALVESAQRGYRSGLVPGPPHGLEQRIIHWQEVYRRDLPEELSQSLS